MAKTENFNQERIDARDYAMQVFCWCIVAAMHQNEGIGANRLMKACNEMEEFEAKYATAIRYGGREAATDAMRKDLTGLCDLDIRLPVLKAPPQPQGRTAPYGPRPRRQDCMACHGCHLPHHVQVRQRSADPAPERIARQLPAVPRMGCRRPRVRREQALPHRLTGIAGGAEGCR